MDVVSRTLFLFWMDSGVSLKSRISRLPRATLLASCLDCSTVALSTPQRVLPIWELVELKMLDFSDSTRAGMYFGRILGSTSRTEFPSPWPTTMALLQDCSRAALATPQKVSSIWELVELKMFDFSDRGRTGISILTSAADYSRTFFSHLKSFLSDNYQVKNNDKQIQKLSAVKLGQ